MTEYRGYNIVPLNNLIGYTLQTVGRGSIPNALKGSFTSVRDARNLIDLYRGKEEIDGETESSGGSEQVQRRSGNGRKSADVAG